MRNFITYVSHQVLLLQWHLGGYDRPDLPLVWGKTRNTWRILVEESTEQRPIGRLGRWEGNMKMDLREADSEHWMIPWESCLCLRYVEIKLMLMFWVQHIASNTGRKRWLLLQEAGLRLSRPGIILVTFHYTYQERGI